MNSDNTSKRQELVSGQDEQHDGANVEALEKVQRLADGSIQPNEFYEQLLGPDLYEFYFGDRVSKEVADLMADCIDKSKWETLFDKFKEGKISSEDLTEVVMISHVHAVERSNPISSPEEIIDRAFESKVRGKLGRKLIAATVNALAQNNLLNAPKEAVRGLIDYTMAKSDLRAESDVSKMLPATIQEEKIRDSVEQAYDKFVDSLNVADNIRDITYDEILARLSDEMDPYFGITHQIVFDLGWELISRLKPELGKCVVVYVAELDRAWTDSVASNMKQSDRHMTRYLLRDVKQGDTEKVSAIQNAVAAKYRKRLTEKADFIQVLWERESKTQ